MPLWRTIGRASWVLRARTLPKTIAITIAIIAAAVGLTFIHKGLQPFRRRHTGTGRERRQVFAAVDGEVTEVLVKRNSKVKKGDVLVRLRNPDIAIQLEELRRDSLAKHDCRAGQGSRPNLFPARARRSIAPHWSLNSLNWKPNFQR